MILIQTGLARALLVLVERRAGRRNLPPDVAGETARVIEEELPSGISRGRPYGYQHQSSDRDDIARNEAIPARRFEHEYWIRGSTKPSELQAAYAAMTKNGVNAVHYTQEQLRCLSRKTIVDFGQKSTAVDVRGRRFCQGRLSDRLRTGSVTQLEAAPRSSSDKILKGTKPARHSSRTADESFSSLSI